MWMIWVAAHRSIFYALVAVVVWAFSTFWFFRFDIKRMVKNSRGHTWSVNMETKTGTGALKRSSH